MSDFYVGLMSGTSMDGIDAALVSFDDQAVVVRATHSQPYSEELKNKLLTAIRAPLDVQLDPSGELDRQVGESFRDAALAVIDKSNVSLKDIAAIGSHGQTLRHQPDADPPFSLQIGNADIIAASTGITTVANFRQADIAVGGQGAPLVPPFHKWLFGSGDVNRVVANIGGIANITVLSADGSDVMGFDTGPGNGLMDAWIRQHLGRSFDSDGEWAASGSVVESLIEEFLTDPYFDMSPPKSTGFEYFNPDWLHTALVEILCKELARLLGTRHGDRDTNSVSLLALTSIQEGHPIERLRIEGSGAPQRAREKSADHSGDSRAHRCEPQADGSQSSSRVSACETGGPEIQSTARSPPVK